MLREKVIADLDLVNDVLKNNDYTGSMELQRAIETNYRNVGCNLGEDVMENMRIIRAELQSLLFSLS